MPLIRRIPKRGFNNTRFTTRYIGVNVADLNKFEDGANVDETALRSVGLANGPGAGIKILGTGELSKKLNVTAQPSVPAAKIEGQRWQGGNLQEGAAALAKA